MPKNTNFLKSSGGKKEDDSHFIPLSDIMTALMLLFLLISVVYMIKVDESVRIPRIFKEISQGLSEKLGAEFQTDLKAWGAVIDKDLTVRFTEPDILFKTGSAALSPRFQEILDDFFPRYLKIMMEKEFVNNIEEIRIEGHTSSFWGDLSGDEAYFKNMELSQERTRAVLSYLLNSNLSRSQKEWLRKHFRAIGFASARPLNAMGEPLQKGEVEHALNSQRVEFRVRTNIEERIADIVERRDASALEALELPQKPQIELIGANSHGFDGGDSSVNSGGNLAGNSAVNSSKKAGNLGENFGENFALNLGENSSVNSNENSAGNSALNSGENSANLGGNSSVNSAGNSALNSGENSQKKAKNPPKRKGSNTSVIIAATLAVVAILIALILKFVVFRKKNNDWEMLEKSAISKENSNSNLASNSSSNSSENSTINSNANSNSSENLAKNSNANSSENSNTNSSVNSNLNTNSSVNSVSTLNTNSSEKPTSNSTENSAETKIQTPNSAGNSAPNSNANLSPNLNQNLAENLGSNSNENPQTPQKP